MNSPQHDRGEHKRKRPWILAGLHHLKILIGAHENKVRSKLHTVGVFWKRTCSLNRSTCPRVKKNAERLPDNSTNLYNVPCLQQKRISSHVKAHDMFRCSSCHGQSCKKKILWDDALQTQKFSSEKIFEMVCIYITTCPSKKIFLSSRVLKNQNLNELTSLGSTIDCPRVLFGPMRFFFPLKLKTKIIWYLTIKYIHWARLFLLWLPFPRSEWRCRTAHLRRNKTVDPTCKQSNWTFFGGFDFHLWILIVVTSFLSSLSSC